MCKQVIPFFTIAVLIAATAFAALVECPDCGSDVSTHAAKCPRCGCPISVVLQGKKSQQAAPAVVGRIPTSFNSLRDSLVMVSTDKGTGSGFIVRIGDKLYVMTNAHVLYGGEKITVRQISGNVVRWSELQLAKDRDLARLLVAETGLPPLDVFAGSVSIDDAVSVFGNSLGSGTVTWLKGRVLSVGPDKIEVDAAFVSGNSGSPIVMASGDVFAVATYVTHTSRNANWVVAGTRFEKVRRFGLRLLPGIEWVTVNPRTFLSQVELIRDVNELMDDIVSIILHYQGKSDARSRGLLDEDYDMSREEERFSSSHWCALIKTFVETRNLYREYQYWDRQRTQGTRNLKISQANAFRRRYGTSFSRVSFERELRRRSEARDDAFAALYEEPILSLEETRWLTEPIQGRVEEDLEFLELIRGEIKKIMAGSRYQNETYSRAPWTATPTVR